MMFSKPFLPSSLSYDAVRPHHVLALYATASVLASVLSSSRLLARLRTHLSNHATALLSRLSDVGLPLLYSPLLGALLPDALVRRAIRVRCRHTLVELGERGAEADQVRKMGIVRELQTLPIAVATAEANAQHYEVPAKFYDLCLGPNKKYSSGLWPFPATKYGRGRGMSYRESLEASEVAMLDLYVERAQITDGMHVVDLGCGWGSMTLHLAKRFPKCKITSISNSHSQREYIMATAKERGYAVENIRVITCDVSRWQDEDYCQEMLAGVKDNDRVVSIEM
jgi:cyclopropane-fatty-acyl-phospholipid synthase